MVPIIRGLITQPGEWLLVGYKTIEQCLPMNGRENLKNKTHTATFFAVNGCTMSGACARVECQTRGKLTPLYDKLRLILLLRLFKIVDHLLEFRLHLFHHAVLLQSQLFIACLHLIKLLLQKFCLHHPLLFVNQ